LVATVIGAIRCIIANLAPASERQDHTALPSAPAPLVLRRQNVHRIPRPTSVTIAIRPSCGGGTARTLRLIWVSEKTKYFFGKGWTAESKNSPTGKSVGLPQSNSGLVAPMIVATAS
jgi:hypothetical protein